MKYFRKIIAYKKLTAFLAIGMLLRSIVAVGYMLDTNPGNGDLFSITICDGPAAINAISGLDDHAQHHNGHHNNHNSGNDKPDYAVQDHSISSCSFWSASSIALAADTSFFNAPNYYLSGEVVIYENHLKLSLTNHTRFARAPPAQKLI